MMGNEVLYCIFKVIGNISKRKCRIEEGKIGLLLSLKERIVFCRGAFDSADGSGTFTLYWCWH
jgi:hypothetical protein